MATVTMISVNEKPLSLINNALSFIFLLYHVFSRHVYLFYDPSNFDFYYFVVPSFEPQKLAHYSFLYIPLDSAIPNRNNELNLIYVNTRPLF